MVANVLVTGGAGYIGSQVVSALRRAGQTVRVLDLRPASARHRADLGCDCIQGNIADAQVVSRGVRGVEVVYHLAWSPFASDSVREVRDNLLTTLSLLKAALIASVQQVLFASSAVVYGPTGPVKVDEEHACCPELGTIGGLTYGISKLACEKYCLALARQGLPTTVFRLHGVFGQNRLGQFGQMIEDALAHRPVRVIQGAGGEYIHVADVVGAFLRAARDPAAHGEIFNLAGPHTYIDLDLARVIIGATNSESPIEPIDDPTQAMISVSVDKLRHLLGYAPQREEFLPRLIRSTIAQVL